MTGKEAAEFAVQQDPVYIIPIHWMPDKSTYNDKDEIEYIKNNIPEIVKLVIKDLK